jgi:hypothetical protein
MIFKIHEKPVVVSDKEAIFDVLKDWHTNGKDEQLDAVIEALGMAVAELHEHNLDRRLSDIRYELWRRSTDFSLSTEHLSPNDL